MTLDHPALWGIDASLEELRGKIGHLVKCAIQNSKVAWSNFSAKRCRRNAIYTLRAWHQSSPHTHDPDALCLRELGMPETRFPRRTLLVSSLIKPACLR